jgi:hypothetical protein
MSHHAHAHITYVAQISSNKLTKLKYSTRPYTSVVTYKLPTTSMKSALHKNEAWEKQKSKVKLASYTPWKALGGRGRTAPLNLGTRRGWVVSITPRPRFTPAERAPGTHCTGGWVGPRAGLDAEVRGKIPCLCRGSNPGRPVRSQTLYRLSYTGLYKILVGGKFGDFRID